MKTSKKLTVILMLIVFAVVPAIQSCKKYTDGPAISLRSKTERVANTWKVDNYKVNGDDYTSFVSEYYETYTKEGNFSYSWGSFSGDGKWAFQNDKEEIKITGINNQSSQTLFILKLEEKQFWYYYMDGNDRKEFHLVQK